jgi:hypothetical protein
MWSICEFIPPFWIFQVSSNSIIDYVQFITLILLDLMTFCNFNLILLIFIIFLYTDLEKLTLNFVQYSANRFPPAFLAVVAKFAFELRPNLQVKIIKRRSRHPKQGKPEKQNS